jgi:Tol biopolymer transport system component
MTEPQPPPTARETCEMVLFRGCGLIILLVFLACSGLSIMSQPRQSAFRGTPGQEVIVYATDRDRGLHLYAINPDGTGETRMTYNLGQFASPFWPFPLPSSFGAIAMTRHPHPAPNHEGIVYVSNFAPGANHKSPNQLYQLRLDGSPQHQIATPLDDDRTVVLSPDGAYLAFSEKSKVYVARRDGSDTRCLSCGIAKSWTDGIRWSPDSLHVVFAAVGRSVTHYVVHRDGHTRSPLPVPMITDRVRAFQWSPDGTRFVFVGTYQGQHNIYTMQLDGSEVQQLTTTGVDDSPAWSPDGTQIVFASRRDRSRNMNHEVNHDIYVMNADGSNQRRLTFGPGDNMEPVWVRVP